MNVSWPRQGAIPGWPELTPRFLSALATMLVMAVVSAAHAWSQPSAVVPRDEATLERRAEAELVRGRYAEAEALFEQAAADDPAGDGALGLARLLQRLGRAHEAQPILEGIVERHAQSSDAAALTRAGQASQALGRYRAANTLLRRAEALAPGSVPTNIAWGELFLEKYNRPDAIRSFRAALEKSPESAAAHLGLARALADENPPAAVESARRALELDPSRTAAYVLLAGLALDEGRPSETAALVERALDINPVDFEALSLRAALAYAADDRQAFERDVARVLAINSAYGDIYRVTGERLARQYRFEEAVPLVEKALEVDPRNNRARSDLGLLLLRTGDETQARTLLAEAFKNDPYDVVTYNLLSLLDTLDGFDTIERSGLVVKLPNDEAPVMGELVPALAARALATLEARYAFSPRGPILVEMFSRHDDFAVRTLGLPGMIGALGACFGRVVTLDSPKARAPGTFNWEATLWHELAHVITLQMSNQRVPRWLSEGVSVYEERLASPGWGRESELEFLRAYAGGRLLDVRRLNTGFTNPRTITLAYHQASVVVESIVDAHGEAGLRRLIAAYASGADDDRAMQQAFGQGLEPMAQHYDEYLARRYGDVRRALSLDAAVGDALAGADLEELRRLAAEHVGSYDVHMALARGLIDADRAAEADEVLRRAASLLPTAIGPESPRALLAGQAERLGDHASAMAWLEAMLADDHTGLETARTLARLAEQAADTTRQMTAHERIVQVSPFESASHAALGRLLRAQGRIDPAIGRFRLALAAGPIDPSSVRTDLAEALVAVGRSAEAKEQVLFALEATPRYERAQELLLQLVDGPPVRPNR